MEIGKKLKEARMETKLTQEQVAEEIGVSRQSISNWENEKSLPDIISVIKLSDLYNVSLDILLKGDKDMMEKIEKDTNVVKSNEIMRRAGWVFMLASLLMSLYFKYDGTNDILLFISAAAPWVLCGLGVACLAATFAKKEK